MKRSLFAIAAAAIALTCGAASAQSQIGGAGGLTASTVKLIGTVGPLASATASTTSYVDVAGATVTYPRSPSDPAITEEYAEACYSATLSKATAGSGTLALYVNGAVNTGSTLVVANGAGNGAVSKCVLIAPALDQGNSALAQDWSIPQTIKLQAKSSDTNVLTVTDASLVVRRWRR